VYAAEEALRGRDNSGMLAGVWPFQQMTDVMSRLSDLAKGHPTADGVVIVQLLHIDEKGANFWVYSHERDGNGGGHRHEGTWEELRQKGFDCKIEGDGPNAKFTLSLGRYFANTPIPHEIIEGPKETPNVGLGDYSPSFFLRRLPLKTADEPAEK
jgi:hypothetical protein